MKYKYFVSFVYEELNGNEYTGNSVLGTDHLLDNQDVLRVLEIQIAKEISKPKVILINFILLGGVYH